jgi:uncharacterized membrane protein
MIAVAAIWAFSQLHSLPGQIPSHFDINGRADGYSGKYFVLAFLPLLNLFVVALLASLAKISPKGYQMPNGQGLIGLFNIGVTFLLMSIYMAMILEAKDPAAGYFAKFVVPGFAVFTIFTGNYLGKVERNFFIGFRLPWTLASEDNWKRTHRLAGKTFVAFGLAMLAIPWFGGQVWMALALILIATLIPTVYSLSYYMKNEREKAA